MSLERIVRPFAPGEVFTARVLPPVQPAVAALPDVVLTFGNAIQLLAKPNGVTALFGGVKLNEVSRRTSVKRVFNPSDNSQFVDVERIDQLTLKDAATSQLHTFQLNNPA
jgi:hypothetical protein